MRLATARDELAPLRDPDRHRPGRPASDRSWCWRGSSRRLGDLELVTSHDIEGLFAVDLAFLQDFYGVINFGSQEEYDALVRRSRARRCSAVAVARPPRSAAQPEPTPRRPAADDGGDGR